MEPVPRPANHVGGLDSLRFVCALWVTFSHNTSPPLTYALSRDSHLGLVVRGLYGNLWNGQAAVIVFFVISGFCIHFPFAGTEKRPALAEFYSRRFIRLAIPAAATILLMLFVDCSGKIFEHTVLWSLVAEMIYYLLYPALRVAQIRAGGWKPLIVAAYAGALIVVLTHPGHSDYHTFGDGLNWIVALPCWLLGCALAEAVRQDSRETPFVGGIWVWRAGILAAAWICSALRFHSSIGLPWTLDLFALGAYAWLSREIAYRRTHAPAAWLESAGLWSYSLYLIHPVVIIPFEDRVQADSSVWMVWAIMLTAVFVASYVFSLVVEQPSHALARRVSGMLRPRALARVV